MSAVAAGADSVTAVVYVGWQRNEKATVRPSGDIARHPKVKKPTGKPKTVVGIGWIKKIKKTWMMHLPDDYRHGVWVYYWLSGSEYCRYKPPHVAIFAAVAGNW